MNKRDFGKLLASLDVQLKAEIKEIKVEVASAKRLKTNLKKYFDDCQKLIERISNGESGIQAYHDLALSIKDKVAVVGTEANANLEEISGAVASVQSKIQEMETAYTSFSEINEKVIDDESGLEALLSQATDLRADIVAVKTNSDTLYKEIRKFRDEAANYIKEIGGLKDTAVNSVDEIKHHEKLSLDLKTKIEDIFNIGSQGVHSNYFVERRNQLLKIVVFWLFLFLALLGVTVTLAIIYILPLTSVLDDPTVSIGIEIFLVRFSIISPSLFGAVFALRQFSNDRRLYEKYAFKAISTYSAESSVATLSRSLSAHSSEDKDTRIVNFAVDIFNATYQEPLEPTHEKWTFRGNNKLLDLTAEINQSVGEVKKDVDRLTDNLTDGA